MANFKERSPAKDRLSGFAGGRFLQRLQYPLQVVYSRTHRMSLKTKMALAVAALFVLFVITASYFTLVYFERTFKESISAQQFSLVSNLANNIDDKLRIAQNALIAVAATAPEDVFTNPDRAQRFLDGNVGLLSIFDNGIFFIDKTGRLRVESPYRPNRRGKDLWFREWVQKTVIGGKPYISEPYISTHTPGLPAVVFTVPIFDRSGKLTGMMTGSLDLLGKNFLAELSKTRIGQSGYLFLTDSNRMVITYPDPQRIMKLAAFLGDNPLYDRAINGFEGSGETVNTGGTPVLSSYKRLKMASWILGESYPTTEAYAPLVKAKQYFVGAAIVMTILLLFITKLIMRRLLSPLQIVTRHMANLTDKSGKARLLTLARRDEIAVLAATFNTMIQTLDQQREALTTKQEQLEELNNTLEERIVAALSDLRHKDQLMITQSRQAAMGEMIGHIAHQWRQPLNALGLVLADIGDAYKFNELDAEYLEQAMINSNRLIQKMSTTISDFSNFFRPDKEIVAFSAQKQINEAVALVEASFRNNNVILLIDAPHDVTLVGFPNEFSQVLLNLLSNAKEAIKISGIATGRVEVGLGICGDQGYVTVRDNGGGIPDAIMDKIYEPYFSTKPMGTGIGLYMSKMIIERNMEGCLSARNIEGGAEFRIAVRVEST